MLHSSDWLRHALTLLNSSDPYSIEINCRRAVSASYYALFHTLTNTGAALLGAGGDDALRGQIARAFNHGAMRQVCLVFKAASTKGFQAPYQALMPVNVDLRLFAVAEAFLRLQEARHTADYDLMAAIRPSDAMNELRQASAAVGNWQAISATPEARVFLTALLLTDRWTRRG